MLSLFYGGGKLRHQEVRQLAQGHTASGRAGSGCLPLSGPHFPCLCKGIPGSPGSGILVLVPVLTGAGVSWQEPFQLCPRPSWGLEGSSLGSLMAFPQEAFQGSGSGQVRRGEPAAPCCLILSPPSPSLRRRHRCPPVSTCTASRVRLRGL